MHYLHRLPALIITLSVLLAAPLAEARTAAPHTSTGPSRAKLLPPLKGAYAALGASETYGVGATPTSRGYAYLVAKQLHATKFVDTGIPGAPLPQAYATELTDALAIRPSLCTLFFGFNDLRAGVSKKVFLTDLRDLAGALHRAHARVLIIGLPNLDLLPAVRQYSLPGVAATVRSWNAGERKVARQTGSTFLDLDAFSAELRAHPGYIAADGLHPNNRGHQRLAQVVLAAIRQNHLWR